MARRAAVRNRRWRRRADLITRAAPVRGRGAGGAGRRDAAGWRFPVGRARTRTSRCHRRAGGGPACPPTALFLGRQRVREPHKCACTSVLCTCARARQLVQGRRHVAQCPRPRQARPLLAATSRGPPQESERRPLCATAPLAAPGQPLKGTSLPPPRHQHAARAAGWPAGSGAWRTADQCQCHVHAWLRPAPSGPPLPSYLFPPGPVRLASYIRARRRPGSQPRRHAAPESRPVSSLAAAEHPTQPVACLIGPVPSPVGA